MEQPSTSSYDPEQVQGLISSHTTQGVSAFSGLLTPPKSKEDIPQRPPSIEPSFKPKFASRIRPRVTKGSPGGWTRSCSPFDNENDNGTPRGSLTLVANRFTSSYPVSGVHRTVKSSTKQRVLSTSYPLLIPNPAKFQSLSGKRLPGSGISVLETLPCVSTPFQYHAFPSPDLELQSSDTCSPEDDMDSSGEDGPIPTQSILEGHEHSESEAELAMPQFHGRLVSPPNEEPIATNFYEHYRDQMTDHPALHAECQRLRQLSLGRGVIDHQGPNSFAGEAQDQLNRPYVSLEEYLSKYLDKEIMELYEGGPPGLEDHCVRDPTRSDPFDADYERCMPITSPMISPDQPFDNLLLEFYDGRGLPPTQAFDEDLLALYQGREPEEEDVIKSEWDSISDDSPLGLDRQDVAPNSQWSLSPPLYNTSPLPLQY